MPKDGYEKIKQIVRSHHERMDGNGYPDGLKGDSIPYFARMLSIADTFDAMVTQRCYNQMKTIEEALEELYKSSRKQLDEAGRITWHLDPNLVDIFIVMIKNNKNTIEQFIKKDHEIARCEDTKNMILKNNLNMYKKR